MAPQKIIIDTDPGVDDVLALLLALSASEEELEVLLISLTFGNIDVESCLLNVVSMFHVLELERKWRIENGLPTGFGSLSKFKPIIAVGADRPLEDEDMIMADHFHGSDGLQGVHAKAPHFTPEQTWKHMFSTTPLLQEDQSHPPNFKPTNAPAHREILRILAENPVDSVTIVAVGPLPNIALAAAEDVETFLRVREVVVMGGNIDVPGNVTPIGEFNTVSCPWSAARLYALTSPSPASTAPSNIPTLPPVPSSPPSRRLNLTLFPLDVTTTHVLSQSSFDAVVSPLVTYPSPSPLAAWSKVFVDATFEKVYQVRTGQAEFSLHDPLCVFYLLTRHGGGWEFVEERDIRVETKGEWTRGMCVVDQRGKKRVQDPSGPVALGDEGVWLHAGFGNRIRQVVDSPDRGAMGREMLERIYAVGGGGDRGR